MSTAPAGREPPLTLNKRDFECDISAYNQGRWNNYNELYNAVDAAITEAGRASLKLEIYALPNGQKAGFLVESDGTPKWARLVGNDGGTLVGNDGASLIGTDSAGLIATVINRMVAAGAGNVIPTAGGSLKNYVNNKGFFSNPRLISNSPRVLSDWGAGLMSKMTNPPRSLLSDPRKYVKYGSIYYVIK